MTTPITHTTITITARMRSDVARGRGVVKAAGTVAWYFFLIFIAVIAIGVELDRQAKHDPAIGSMLPAAVRSDALESLARLAFNRGDAAQGEALARQLVERRPVPAEGLSLYANGLLANGHPDLATSVLELAAQRGWRDRFVQKVVIASALQNDEPAVAAQRVVGLWRQGERADWLKELTRATLTAPKGLSAFADVIVDGDNSFGSDFLLWSAAAVQPASVEFLARDMARHRMHFDCAWFSGESDRLVRLGRHEAAAEIWNALCMGAHRRSMSDLSFVPSQDAPGPFDWKFPESPGVITEVLERQDGFVLHYSNAQPVYQVIARRYLTLGPGRHVLSSGNDSDSIAKRWNITCIEADGAARELKLDEMSEGARSFVVPARCVVQELRFAARLASGEINRITIQ